MMNSVLSPQELALYDQLTRQGYSQHDAIMAITDQRAEGQSPGVSDLLASLGILGGTGAAGYGVWRATRDRRGGEAPAAVAAPPAPPPPRPPGRPTQTQPQSPAGGGPPPAPMDVAQTTPEEAVVPLAAPTAAAGPVSSAPASARRPMVASADPRFRPASISGQIPGERLSPQGVVAALEPLQQGRQYGGGPLLASRSRDKQGRSYAPNPPAWDAKRGGSVELKKLGAYQAPDPRLLLGAQALLGSEDIARLLALGDTGETVLRGVLAKLPAVTREPETAQKEIDSFIAAYRASLGMPARGKQSNRGVIGSMSRNDPGVTDTVENRGQIKFSTRPKSNKSAYSSFQPAGERFQDRAIEWVNAEGETKPSEPPLLTLYKATIEQAEGDSDYGANLESGDRRWRAEFDREFGEYQRAVRKEYEASLKKQGFTKKTNLEKVAVWRRDPTTGEKAPYLREDAGTVDLSDLIEAPFDNPAFYAGDDAFLQPDFPVDTANDPRLDKPVHPSGLTLRGVIRNHQEKLASFPQYAVEQDMGTEGLREPIGPKAAAIGTRAPNVAPAPEAGMGPAPAYTELLRDESGAVVGPGERIVLQEPWFQFEQLRTAGAENAARAIRAEASLARDPSRPAFNAAERIPELSRQWSTDPQAVARVLRQGGFPLEQGLFESEAPERQPAEARVEALSQLHQNPVGWGSTDDPVTNFLTSFSGHAMAPEALTEARILAGGAENLRRAKLSLMPLVPGAVTELGKHMSGLSKDQKHSVVAEAFSAAVDDLAVLSQKHPEVVRKLFKTGGGNAPLEAFVRSYARKVAIARNLQATEQPTFIVSGDALGLMALEARDDGGLDNSDIATVLERKIAGARTPLHAAWRLDDLVAQAATETELDPNRNGYEAVRGMMELDDPDLQINKLASEVSGSNINLSFGNPFVERDPRQGLYDRGVVEADPEFTSSPITVIPESGERSVEEFTPKLNSVLKTRRDTAAVAANEATGMTRRRELSRIAKQADADLAYLQENLHNLARVASQLENGILPTPDDPRGKQVGRTLALSLVTEPVGDKDYRSFVGLRAPGGQPGGPMSLDALSYESEDEGRDFTPADRQEDIDREVRMMGEQPVGLDEAVRVDVPGGMVAGPLKFKNLGRGDILSDVEAAEPLQRLRGYLADLQTRRSEQAQVESIFDRVVGVGRGEAGAPVERPRLPIPDDFPSQPWVRRDQLSGLTVGEVPHARVVTGWPSPTAVPGPRRGVESVIYNPGRSYEPLTTSTPIREIVPRLVRRADGSLRPDPGPLSVALSTTPPQATHYVGSRPVALPRETGRGEGREPIQFSHEPIAPVPSVTQYQGGGQSVQQESSESQAVDRSVAPARPGPIEQAVHPLQLVRALNAGRLADQPGVGRQSARPQPTSWSEPQPAAQSTGRPSLRREPPVGYSSPVRVTNAAERNPLEPVEAQVRNPVGMFSEQDSVDQALLRRSREGQTISLQPSRDVVVNTLAEEASGAMGMIQREAARRRRG